MNRLIGIAGPAGSGKSTVAAYLVDKYGFERLRFASALKNMARALFRDLGFESQTIERLIDGDLKQTQLLELGGATPRQVMQTLGTEWGRETLYPDFWVDILRPKILETLGENIPVVVDDIRHINEAKTIQDLGGDIWAMKVPEAVRETILQGTDALHTSERIRFTDIADRVIENNGTIESLHRGLDLMITEDL